MGGDGGPGTNPDQLFAVAYSSCFLGAMKLAAKRKGESIPDEATLTADVSFVDREDDVGFAIAVALKASVPAMDKAKVEEIMRAAHDICPYSWAIKQTVDVKLSAA
jgi:Ohr subfamily peroxiredoxin